MQSEDRRCGATELSARIDPIAIVAPFIGAIADAGGWRKPWLFVWSVSLYVTAGLL